MPIWRRARTGGLDQGQGRAGPGRARVAPPAREGHVSTMLRPLGETRRHFWLAQRMAGLHGLDLAGAGARGDLDQATWAAMVQHCRGCAWTEGCERYLGRGEAADALPEGCVNRLRFATLRACEEMELCHETQ